MNAEKALDQLALSSGIVPSFKSLQGEECPTSSETKLALLQANGWQLDNDAMVIEAYQHHVSQLSQQAIPRDIVGCSGQNLNIPIAEPVTWYVHLEGAPSIFAEGHSQEMICIPAMPSGVHSLVTKSTLYEANICLIVAPKLAPSVFEKTGHSKLWGANLALYGVHSERNPGIGDYQDLANIATGIASHGANFIGINPVHAIGWNSKDVISPYSPSHRGFLNTNHIALDQVLPVSESTLALISKGPRHVDQKDGQFIDYPADLAHHQACLKALYTDFIELASAQQNKAFQAFWRQNDGNLDGFVEYESLSDRYGTDWRSWPKNTSQSKDGQSFHAWLQWHAETQLQAAQHAACSADMELGLYLDLAVGSRRDGAEAWSEKDSIADNVSIGAPPDHLSPAGQNWNLTAFSPSKLAATHYRAFRNILARNMRHCGVLRIDHVLGLNRSFWIPDNGVQGGYITQNFEAMLAIVRIEAERAGTIIIGEDLGLVPSGFRTTLKDSGIYSYSVLQYEKDSAGSFRNPSSLNPQSLACFGTHDTPTMLGFFHGRDIDWWQKLEWIDKPAAIGAQTLRQKECTELLAVSCVQKMAETDVQNGSDGTVDQTFDQAIHEILASSPVAMISVQMDDLDDQIEAQNLPGTIDEHPNWRRRSVRSVDMLSDHSKLKSIGELMDKCGRNTK